MLYEEFVRDFAERTEANLIFLDRAKKSGESSVFEVPQLINSTLGLLIFPVEEYIVKIKEGGFASDADDEEILSRIQIIKGSKPATIDAFLKKLRNAFAHNNIQVRGGREITSLVLYNRWDMSSPITWKAEIQVQDLRELLLLLARNLSNHVMKAVA